MAVNFSVSALFEIQDDATATLARIAEGAEAVATATRNAAEGLAAIGRGFDVSRAVAGVDLLTESLAGLNRVAGETGPAMAAGLTEATEATARAVAGIDELAAAYGRAAGTAAEFNLAASRAGRGGGGGVIALPGPGGGGGGGYTAPPLASAFPPGAGGGGGRGPIPIINPFGPGGGGGGGGPGGGGGGGAGGGGPAYVAGGGGGLLSGMWPMIEVASGYGAWSAAMKEDLALRNALIEGLHITPDMPGFGAAMQQLRGVAATSAAGTIYGERRSAQGIMGIARELGFTGDEGLAKLAQVARPLLQASEVAEMTGLGSMETSVSAGIEYAHMTGSYEPTQLEQRLNVLRSLAQLTRQTMKGEESILKYSVPIGIAAGIDPDKVAVETGYLQQRGFNSSTAGTGLSALILGATNTGGPVNAHLAQMRQDLTREFENSLGLKPGTGHTQIPRGSKHDQALRALGITDAKGNLTTLDAEGHFSLDALEKRISDYSTAHPKETLNTLHDAFGTRGERIAAIYIEPDAAVRKQRFAEAVGTSPTSAQIQKMLSDAPMQQFEQTLARLADIGNTLATATLPQLNEGLKLVNSGLSSLGTFLKDNPRAAEAGGVALAGVSLAGLFGTGRWALNRIFPGVAGRAAAGTGVAGSVMRALPGLATLGSVAYYAHDLLEQGSDAAEEYLFGPERAAKARQFRSSGPWGQAGAGQQQAPNITIQLGGITLNGVVDDMKAIAERLFHDLAEKLGHALSSTSGAGAGSGQSPYVDGGMIP